MVREVQVDADTGKKPKVVRRLGEWEYLERALHRILCGWGRGFAEWDEKVALSRHVWEHAEAVRRIRERLVQFPGTHGNLDQAVDRKWEELANAVLLAPSFEDAVDGAYSLLTGALVRSYIDYTEHAHPVHDAPTLAAIAENVRAKESMRLWHRERRRRVPHQTDSAYRDRIEMLWSAEPLGEPAQPVGIRTDFRPPARAAHPQGSLDAPDIMPFLEADFTTDIEARRLFWCLGYLREMNLAEDQLIWLYDAWFMPWEFQQDVSRHMWDESRHGDSGRSRLLDFGVDIPDIGWRYYDEAFNSAARVEVADGEAPPMDAEALYQSVFTIGMVAETGHFTVKHEAFADFKEGGDMESAEMVLFDIIDETSHVQYAHRWLPELSRRTGRDPEAYREEGVQARARHQAASAARADEQRKLRREGPAFEHYERLKAILRQHRPLSNVHTCPPRTEKPM